VTFGASETQFTELHQGVSAATAGHAWLLEEGIMSVPEKKIAELSAGELKVFVKEMQREWSASADDVQQELSVHANDRKAVRQGFMQRQLAEKQKEKGNSLFGRGQFEAALQAYDAALSVCMMRESVVRKEGRSALDKRMLAVIHSNCSACCLAMGQTDEAARNGWAATDADPTFEKGFLRLGMALEAMAAPAEALATYRRIRSNEVAAKRIAALQPPPVTVTTEGLSGVRDGSLDLDSLETYEKPTSFFGNRIFLPGEPLLPSEARENAPDYLMRAFMLHLSQRVEDLAAKCVGHQHRSRCFFVQEGDPDNPLCVDVLGNFFTLTNVVEDGRSRLVAHNASEIPAILVAFKRGTEQIRSHTAVLWKDLKPLTDMLTRNARLLSDATRAKWGPHAPGLTLSVLTHVAAAELDYSVFEGCAAPGCVVECAGNRCGRCFVARYCGTEHMAAHWKDHKSHCVPFDEREPGMIIDCTLAYCDNPENARDRSCDCVSVPQKTFPGVVVVKVQIWPDYSVMVSDPNGVLCCSALGHVDWAARLKEALLERGPVEEGAHGYFDADMSQEGRITILLDHNWKCTW
jgi:tetratricopeptide (TPR) repeat protein